MINLLKYNIDYHVCHNIPFFHIDNQYLETLVTMGIIGLLALFYLYYQIYKYKQSNSELKTLQITLLVLIMAFGIEATVITDMGFIPKLFVVFTTFTLVTQQRFQSLDKITVKTFTYYVLAGTILLIISRYT